jgi:hypothetical protein
MEMCVARILSSTLPIVEREGRPQEIAVDREQHLAHVHSISLIFLIPLGKFLPMKSGPVAQRLEQGTHNSSAVFCVVFHCFAQRSSRDEKHPP